MNPVEYALGVPGWMRAVELTWLSQIASCLQPGAIWLEVGTWLGKSWTCAALSLPRNSTIISVDTFRGETAEPLKYVQEHGPVLKHFMKEHEYVREQRPDLRSVIFAVKSVEAAPLVPDGICDVILIDGDHRTEHVIADIQGWTNKLKDGGLMCGHDGDDPAVLKGLRGLPYTLDPSLRGSIWVLA